MPLCALQYPEILLAHLKYNTTLTQLGGEGRMERAFHLEHRTWAQLRLEIQCTMDQAITIAVATGA